jgi:DNA-binding response OmpR family regulator
MTSETNGTILVVEDEEEIREHTANCAESMGFKVFQAEDGQVAFDFLKTETPDIIVSDMRMPRKDGMTLLREIRQTGAHPLFLFISAFTSNEYTFEALSLGAYDYLEKPFMPNAIRPILQEMLRISHERKRLLALPMEPGHSIFGTSGPELEILKLVSLRSESLPPMAPEPKSRTLTDHKTNLVKTFSAQVKSQLPQAFAAISNLNQRDSLGSCLGSQFRLMHSIRLTGTSLNLHEIDALARALEKTYILLRVRPNYLNKMTLSTLKSGHDLLISQIQSLASEITLSPDEKRELVEESRNVVTDLNTVSMAK